MTEVGGTDGFRALIDTTGNTRLNDQVPFGTESFVTYSFFDSWPTYGADSRWPFTGLETITDTQRSAIRGALSKYQQVAGLTFIEVPGDATTRGDLVFGMVTDIAGYSAFAYYPLDGIDRYDGSLSGEVWLSRVDVGTMAAGSWGFLVAMHEIGHALGFKHPHEGDPTLVASQDNTANTVMSYTITTIAAQLGALDVAAAQYLYGTRAAADVNGVSAAYDAASGRIAVTGSAAAEIVQGTSWRDTIVAGGGADSLVAGAGDDILDGGNGDDRLIGGHGDDTLIGGAGADTLDGGNGDDTFILLGDGDRVAGTTPTGWIDGFDTVDYAAAPGAIQITVPSSAGGTGRLRAAGAGAAGDVFDGEFDRYVGSAYGDVIDIAGAVLSATLVGGGGADTLGGGGGDDRVEGGPGNDLINGRGGSDVAVLSRPRWEYRVTASGSIVTATALTAAAIAADGSDSLTGVETLEFAGVAVGTTTAVANNLALATATGTTVASGARRAITDFFTASDPESAILGYGFVDRTVGGGRLVRVLGSGAEIDLSAGAGSGSLTAAELGQVYFEGGAAGSVDEIEVQLHDGQEWSRPRITIATVASTNRAPTVTAATAPRVDVGATLGAASLFTVSDPDGNAITSYEFRDNGVGGGQFRLGGVAQGAGTVFAVAATALATLAYAGGAAAGSETIDVRASDGSLWSSWTTVTVTTVQPNRAPVVAAGATTRVDVGASVAAAALFSASDPDGNAITTYLFKDNGSGGGHFRLNGTIQPSGTTFSVGAADLATLVYVGGAAAGTETIEVSASDGALTSAPTSIAVTTIQPNRPPLVTASGLAAVASGASLAAGALFTTSDADGNAITGYEFRDNGAGGGEFRLGGVAKASGASFAVTPAELGDLVYAGGAAAGSETVDIRASDGTAWSAWTSILLSTTAATNTPPSIAAATSAVAANQWVALRSLFTVSDAQDDAITAYRFTDLTAGNGYLWVGNAVVAANSAAEVAAGQLGSAWFRGGAAGGTTDMLRIEAFDGTSWGAGDLAISTLQPNRAPTLTATTGLSVPVGGSITLTAMFTAVDADGDPITAYEIWDSGGGGAFRLAGAPQPSGLAIAVTPSQLESIDYAGGVAAGSEAVWIRARDATNWSSWLAMTVTTTAADPVNAAPVVAVGTATSVEVGATLAASALVTVSDPDGDAIAAYEFRDNAAGGGQFRLGGVAQAAGTVIAVPAAGLGGLVYAAGSTAGAETVDVRASDGAAWSSWTTITLTTIQPNRAPSLAAAGTATVASGSSIAVAGLFTASDPDGNPVASYEVRDTGAGGGALWLGGVPQVAGTPVSVSAAALAGLVYVGGASAGTETIELRASDGALWSGWIGLPITTTAPVSTAPVIAAATASVPANQWVLASTLFSASDPQDDAITRYRFTDLTTGNGYLWALNANVPAGTTVEIASAQLGSVWFRGGAVAPASDLLRIEAFDGTSWGTRELTIGTTQPNRAPSVVAATNASVAVGGTIAVSTLFAASDADGDAITAYELWDSQGGGQFRVAGVARPAGIAISLTPAELGGAEYVGASVAGSEAVWIRAKDASAWSNWVSITAQTIAPAGAPPAGDDLDDAASPTAATGCGCASCTLQGLFAVAPAGAGSTAASDAFMLDRDANQSTAAALFAVTR